jgi:hypothetical protein
MRVLLIEQKVQRMSFFNAFEQVHDQICGKFWIQQLSIQDFKDLHMISDEKRHPRENRLGVLLQTHVFLDAEAPVGLQFVSQQLKDLFLFLLHRRIPWSTFCRLLLVSCADVLLVLEAPVAAEQVFDLLGSLLHIARGDIEDQSAFGRMGNLDIGCLRASRPRLLSLRAVSGVVPPLGRLAPMGLELGSRAAVSRKAQSLAPKHPLIIKILAKKKQKIMSGQQVCQEGRAEPPSSKVSLGPQASLGPDIIRASWYTCLHKCRFQSTTLY